MIKDSYQDDFGNVYTPKLFTESFCYLRSDTHGHVRTLMCQIRDGEVSFPRRANGFRDGRHNPEIWMRENSESMPRAYYSQEVYDKVGCQDCSEQELIELNQQRLRDSRKLSQEGSHE